MCHLCQHDRRDATPPREATAGNIRGTSDGNINGNSIGNSSGNIR